MEIIDVAKIGPRIKEARKAAKLTQSKLAGLMGKTLRVVQKYESGEIEPSISTINKIAGILGVSSAVLLGCNNTRADWRSIAEDPPTLPGRYICIWKGHDCPEGMTDMLNFNGSFFPWERVYSPGRVSVTHWMPCPALPEAKTSIPDR